MNSREKAELIAKAIDDKKGRDIVLLELEGLTLVTDYFVIASANSPTQVRAIADNISQVLAEEGIPELRSSGINEGRWVLIDCSDVVAHIFLEEERDFYKLERLWGDAKSYSYTEVED